MAELGKLAYRGRGFLHHLGALCLSDIRARKKPEVPYYDQPPITTRQKVLTELRHRGLPHYLTLMAISLANKMRGTGSRVDEEVDKGPPGVSTHGSST